MATMIERVALAIRKEITGREDDSPIDGDGQDGVGGYVDIARAAIEAVEQSISEDGDAELMSSFGWFLRRDNGQ